MEKIKTFVRRYLVLSKRLFKKAGFIVILLLVPMILFAMSMAARNGDSGIITVALAMQDNEDPLANEIVDGLLAEDSLIRFMGCESPREATELVENGTADAAWIFSEDLKAQIKKFAYHTHENNAFVAVVQREDNVFLKLSHEKMNAALYPHISLALYSEYVFENVVNISEMSEDELEAFYSAVNAEGADLFEFAYADSDGGGEEVVDTSVANFLVSPLRGLLAIMIVLGGIAVAMFYMQDEKRGVFDRLPRGTGFSFSLVYHATAVVIVAAVVLVALAATKMTVSLPFEVLALAAYCACTVGFCMCLRLVLRDIRLFGSVAPVLIVIMAVLCPIFFKAPNLPIIQHILPAFYYIRAFADPRYVGYMVIYAAGLYILAFVLHSLHVRREK